MSSGYTSASGMPVILASAIPRRINPLLAYAGVVQAGNVGGRAWFASNTEAGEQAAKSGFKRHGRNGSISSRVRGGRPNVAGFGVGCPVKRSGRIATSEKKGEGSRGMPATWDASERRVTSSHLVRSTESWPVLFKVEFENPGMKLVID